MEASANGTDTDQNSPASALNLSEGDSARSVCHSPSGGGRAEPPESQGLASPCSQTSWCYSCSILWWPPVTVPRAWLHWGIGDIGESVRGRGWLLQLLLAQGLETIPFLVFSKCALARSHWYIISEDQRSSEAACHKGKKCWDFLKHSKSAVVKMPVQLPVTLQAEGTASDGWHLKSIKLDVGTLF